MSNKEKAIKLMESIPDSSLGFIVAFLQNMVEDIEDDIFCEKLYQDYLSSPDKNEFVSLEDVLRDLGDSDSV